MDEVVPLGRAREFLETGAHFSSPRLKGILVAIFQTYIRDVEKYIFFGITKSVPG